MIKRLKSSNNLNVDELFNDNINKLNLSSHIDFHEIKEIQTL